MNQSELLDRASQLTGLSFLQLARWVHLRLPVDLLHAKGWFGQAVEMFLGSQSGSLAQPDFPELMIELKTIPLNARGRVMESTYVTTLNVYQNFEILWETSICYQKLQKVLWIPFEADKKIPLAQRRILSPILWTPSVADMMILKEDWFAIMDMVLQGQVERITGSLGQYLHIRPKAANSKQLTKSFDDEGQLIQTLPRGFYLRTRLTNRVIAEHSNFMASLID